MDAPDNFPPESDPLDLGLCNDIYLNHSDYTGEVKDTNNGNDKVFGTDSRDYRMVV